MGPCLLACLLACSFFQLRYIGIMSHEPCRYSLKSYRHRDHEKVGPGVQRDEKGV
jgi:hypothetical protein